MMIRDLRPAVLAGLVVLGAPAPSQASADVDDNPAALTAMGRSSCAKEWRSRE